MITVEQIINLAGQNPHPRFQTKADGIEFTIDQNRNGTGVRIHVKDRKIQRLSSAYLQKYVLVFNSHKPYPKTFFYNSYLPVIMEEAERLAAKNPAQSSLSTEATEQEALRKYRLGQDRFRAALIKLRKQCYVTGITKTEFLRASHIKPWSESNDSERLDPHNGLLLSPNYDHLFDHAYISFNDDGGILVSPKITAEILNAYDIDLAFVGVDLGGKTKNYLKTHRERFDALANA